MGKGKKREWETSRRGKEVRWEGGGGKRGVGRKINMIEFDGPFKDCTLILGR